MLESASIMLEFYDVTLSQNTLHLFLYHRNNAVSFHLIHLRPGGQENAQRILSYPPIHHVIE